MMIEQKENKFSLCDRILQTLSVFTFMSMIFLTISSGLLLLALCFSYYTCWIPILYFIWYIYDFNTSEKGGRSSKFFRSMKYWNYVRDYFSASLIKTVDLDPNRNYLIGVHPHGIAPFGSVLNFATESTCFSEKFPNIKPHLLVMSQSPRLPIWREFILWAGIVSCSENSIKYILNNEGGNVKEVGQAAFLIIGGISEQYLSAPNQYRLYLNNRRGFARVALETGTCLVPAFSFGENDTYKTLSLENCCIKSMEWIFKILCCNTIRYRTPVFRGRCFSFVPFRKKLTMVIGKPIEVTKVEKPTSEQIDELHDLYVKQLICLYEEHKNTCIEDETKTSFLIV